LRWSERALFAAGLTLLAYVALVLFQARLYDINSMQYVSSAKFDKQALPRVPPEMRLPESTLRDGEILGHLEIPRLGVSAAVLEGTASRTLRLGVGHVQGTALPGTSGNSAIAGHRDTFFRALKDIHDGDEIDLRTEDTSTRYLVDWARVVVPEDTSVLETTDESALTLVTCFPFYFVGSAPQRFVVRAHRTPTARPEQTQVNLPVEEANER
jgi:sortase A